LRLRSNENSSKEEESPQPAGLKCIQSEMI
jgi:hypothetical protein